MLKDIIVLCLVHQTLAIFDVLSLTHLLHIIHENVLL